MGVLRRGSRLRLRRLEFRFKVGDLLLEFCIGIARVRGLWLFRVLLWQTGHVPDEFEQRLANTAFRWI